MAAFMTNVLRCVQGASVLEFALISPVVIFMVIGTMDIGQSYFVRAALDGAAQEAARSSSLESAKDPERQAAINERLKAAVLPIAPGATIVPQRRYYENFAKADSRQPEVINEIGRENRTCDRGETFVDANGNGVWDADGGSDGQGGARDVTVIRYTVTYQRLFPMARLVGWPSTVTLQSNSILANQPYGDQRTNPTPQTMACPS